MLKIKVVEKNIKVCKIFNFVTIWFKWECSFNLLLTENKIKWQTKINIICYFNYKFRLNIKINLTVLSNEI